ncbi:ANTAR domain-containing response regulator [Sulfuritalea sp.]|uniref:ANTAR domain-containing response regulator n=1 Tax=Sulfuritalea sp. TaxID=2480090 RepID=UPI00286DF982|nr:ANTAR domain-containing protein [Sulfuritalea sp.]
MRRTGTRSTPELLKDLRSLRVAVFHPRDNDGEQLIRQLQRIGCQVQAFWPLPGELNEPFDVAFLAVNPETIVLDLPWIKSEDAPIRVAVVNYENPTIVDGMLRLGASAVIATPIRSFGVLSTLILARQLAGDLRQERKRVAKLESKLQSIRKITDAKSVLMNSRKISEEDAYAVIRDQAMVKRVTIEEIATAIVNANEILSMVGVKSS